MIGRFFRQLATAFTFMTRFPLVARLASGSSADLAASSRFFPVVGYAIGALAAAVFYYSSHVFSDEIAALLAVIALPLLTGAFHEDGFADTVDGLGGAFARKRKLEIMKDSRIGTYGACALLAVFFLRWQLILEIPMRVVFLTLISAHVCSRWAGVLVGWMLPYVREGASNKPVADGMGWREMLIATFFALLWLYPEWRLHAASMVVALLVACVMAALFRRQIGGVTGDTLGAVNIVVELSILLTWNVADRLGYWAYVLKNASHYY